jgi:hypothetical protein
VATETAESRAAMSRIGTEAFKATSDRTPPGELRTTGGCS